jgi:DNA (cytosine-5)-methyltransferase 1
MQLTFGSLFAAAGGIDLGFERAGLRCAWQVEISEFRRRVLAKHWPSVRRWDDVRTFPPRSVEASYSWRACPTGPCAPDAIRDTTRDEWGVDVICGGDPCQRNSAAGQSTAQSLGGEFIRVIDALRPRIVVRENPTHVRADAPWPWWRFRAGLESLGYAVLPFRLRACCLGAKHQRDRLFLLAERTDAGSMCLAWGHDGKSSASEPRHDIPPLVHAADWGDVRSPGGFRSRAGLSDYVDRISAVGDSVCPQVAEWIGRRIVEAAA